MVSKTQEKKNEAEAEEVLRLRAPVVYTAIKKEGLDELARPTSSLWWSGFGAGFGIFMSIIAMGVLHRWLGKSPVIHFGYCVGFLIVIVGRLQLFTENTITAVIPLLHKPSQRTFVATCRLWGVVFLANMLGILLVSFAILHTDMLNDEIIESILILSEHYIDRTATAFLMQGIPAGFLVAAIVWMLPSSEGFKFWIIVTLTYLISLGEFTHVIAGSGEVFLMMFMGKISLMDTIFRSILPTFIGNVLRGTFLFALLAYGQVREEI